MSDVACAFFLSCGSVADYRAKVVTNNVEYQVHLCEPCMSEIPFSISNTEVMEYEIV